MKDSQYLDKYSLLFGATIVKSIESFPSRRQQLLTNNLAKLSEKAKKTLIVADEGPREKTAEEI